MPKPSGCALRLNTVTVRAAEKLWTWIITNFHVFELVTPVMQGWIGWRCWKRGSSSLQWYCTWLRSLTPTFNISLCLSLFAGQQVPPFPHQKFCTGYGCNQVMEIKHHYFVDTLIFFHSPLSPFQLAPCEELAILPGLVGFAIRFRICQPMLKISWVSIPGGSKSCFWLQP